MANDVNKVIKITLDTSTAKSQVLDIKQKLDAIENKNIQVNITTDTGDVIQDIKELEVLAENTDLNIEIITNSATVVKDITGISNSLEGMHDVTVSINEVTKDGAGVNEVYSGSLVNASNAMENATLSTNTNSAALLDQAKASDLAAKETQTHADAEKKAAMDFTYNAEAIQKALIDLNKASKDLDLSVKEQDYESAAKYRNEIERLNTTLAELNSRQDKIKSKQKELTTETKKTTTGTTKLNKAYNGLDFSMAQISRETPAFLLSPEIGFLAISNNIPIFIDALNRAAEAAGNTKSKWALAGSALFSMNTLLSLAVVALTLFGPKIWNWIADIFSGKSAVDSFNDSLKIMNDRLEYVNALIASDEANLAYQKTLKNVEGIAGAYDTINGHLLDAIELTKEQQKLEKGRLDILEDKKKAAGTVIGSLITVGPTGLKTKTTRYAPGLTAEEEKELNKLRLNQVKLTTKLTNARNKLARSIAEENKELTKNTKKNKKNKKESIEQIKYLTDNGQEFLRSLSSQAKETAKDLQKIGFLTDMGQEFLRTTAVPGDDPVVKTWQQRLQAASEYALVAGNLANAVAGWYDAEVQALEAKGITEGKEYDKAIKRREKAAIAGVIMSTGAAIMSTWASYMENPGSYAGAILAGIQTAALLVTAATQIKNIKTQTLSGGAGGGIKGAAPQYNVIAENAYNPIEGLIDNTAIIAEESKKPIKAYVVAKDISSQQELDRQTASSSSIG